SEQRGERRESRMRMTGADAILRALEAEGVEVVFGIPGGAILPTYDAFARGTTVRHVLARHEQGAGHMAEGYARATGKVGVAIATSGPGATNLVTPIADAWMDSTPLVCITGQVRTHLIGTDAFQECDITGITIPIVKHSWLVQDVEELPHALRAAFHIARTGRCGPVLVDVPRDVQEAELDFVYPEEPDLPGWKPPRAGHPRQIRRAAEAIAAAEKPVLYVGGGTLNADACDELRELAELWRLPVITTLMAKSAFPETHELHFGWPGMHGPKWSNWAMNKCDLLIAVGARFDDRVTGKLSAFAPGATVIHLDIDPAEIGKLRHAEIPVVGPLKQVLRRLAEELRALHVEGHRPRTEAWLRQIADWREEFPLRYSSRGDMLKPQRVLETLQELTRGKDVIWTTGVGQHQMWAMQYLLCERPRTFITSGGLGTMGYGVPAAIGAKAARPEATVVCVDGDGCFQMTGQELATSVLENLPIVVVIVNNGYLGMVRQWQDMFFEERLSEIYLSYHVPDYARLAEAYGALGLTVEREEDLAPALEEALACGRTAVVDARVDAREQCFPMIPAGAAALDLVEYEEPAEVPREEPSVEVEAA
ncbi:MAG: biosynthetic-type acetolactate synthase large subunit, partial [Gaiellaceae bacterium]|nr:biosynthetic-type acetolactate synthase large subunit [Gaiellaceae bacterium]